MSVAKGGVFASLLTMSNVALLAFQCHVFWVLAATFAKGIVAWASFLWLLGPPVAVVSMSCSLWRRRRLWIWLNLAVIITYAIIWIPLLRSPNISVGR
jgi:hypothetical protein